MVAIAIYSSIVAHCDGQALEYNGKSLTGIWESKKSDSCLLSSQGITVTINLRVCPWAHTNEGLQHNQLQKLFFWGAKGAPILFLEIGFCVASCSYI